MSMTREQAWDRLTQYNQEEFHLRHAVTVEHVMRWFARELGYGDREEFWGIVGLLHDLDFERWPEEHCKKSQELMRQAGVDAGWNRQDTDREILLTIRIPKRASGKIDSVSESC